MAASSWLRCTGKVADAQRVMDEATEALPREPPGADDAYSDALERWLALGGADLEERAEQVAAELGLAVGLDRPMTAPPADRRPAPDSASLLLSRYDVFLLRQPTNDLDSSTAWSGWSVSCPACARAPSSSATTASS